MSGAGARRGLGAASSRGKIHRSALPGCPVAYHLAAGFAWRPAAQSSCARIPSHHGGGESRDAPTRNRAYFLAEPAMLLSSFHAVVPPKRLCAPAGMG